MSNTQDIGSFLRSVGNLGEGRVAACITAEFENMGLVLNDVDVDVASVERVNTGSRVYRVLVLNWLLRNGIEFVDTHLIAAKIVQIQEISLPRLASDNTQALGIWARKGTRRQKLEG